MKYFIGVDGGGTKTLGYLGNDKGQIIALTREGPSNYHTVGIDETRKSLNNVIHTLCNRAKINIEEIETISLGLAGVDRLQDKQILDDILSSIGIKSKIILNNDAKTALVGAHGKEEGIVTICGTGSISLGIDCDGKLIRAGGWGHIIGDEGSGYDFGIQCLKAVTKAHDDRGENTTLIDKTLKFLKITSVEEIISFVYDKRTSKENIAGLAPIIFQSAAENDKTSINIVNNSIDELVLLTETVINKLKFNNRISLALDGGIFNNVDMVRNKFITEMKQKFENIDIYLPLFNGALGALIIGWNSSNVKFNVDDLKKQIKDVIKC